MILDTAVDLDDLRIPPGNRLAALKGDRRRITADTALRLSCYFGTTDLFWINLQNRYDLEAEKDALGNSLDRIQPLHSA